MEYTKLRQAAEGWWKQIFFFRFAPFENFMMKLLYEYVDEYKAKGSMS